MDLYSAIFRRKTIKNFSNVKLTDIQLEKVPEILNNVKALFPKIKVKFDILDILNDSRTKPFSTNVVAPYYLIISSEKKGKYLENIGFLGEQIVLEFTKLGIATCWTNLVKHNYKVLSRIEEEPIISIAFGRAENIYYNSIKEINRFSIDKISFNDVKGLKIESAQILESIRVAPSLKNFQPWKVKFSQDDTIDFYIRHTLVSDNNRYIDMGIAIAHAYITMKTQGKKFFFFELEDRKIKEYEYVGTVSDFDILEKVEEENEEKNADEFIFSLKKYKEKQKKSDENKLKE